MKLELTTGASFHARLHALGACREARTWVGCRSLRTAWRLCERADWMLWLAGVAGVDARLVTRAACDCARTALVYLPPGEDIPRLAIEAAERYCEKRATREEAYMASYGATYAVDTGQASRHLYVYNAARFCLNDADYAAEFAVHAASYGNCAEATARQCADLVRARIPYEVIAAALERAS